MTTPSDYNLPHDEFRPGQLEAIQFAEAIQPGQMFAISAPTGQGKSALAAGLAFSRPVTALTKTLALLKQYEDTYGFVSVYGREQYECPHHVGLQADSCSFTHDMVECPQVGPRDEEGRLLVDNCDYYRTRQRCMKSPRRALSYAYFWRARWAYNQPGTLFCDEAHALSDQILSLASLEMSNETRISWGLSEFPSANGTAEWAREKVAAWTKQANDEMPSRSRLPERRWGAAEKLRFKLSEMTSLLGYGEWFIASGMEGLSARPLTPAPFFKSKFIYNTQGTILMSGTIGDVSFLEGELGYQGIVKKSFPHVIPKERRPVYFLKNAPEMTAKATKADFDRQAELIAWAVAQHPRDYRGIIHVSRWTETEQLALRLRRLGLYDRIWIPPHATTQMQVEMFLADPTPGLLAIAPNWREGLDMYEDRARLSICAKVMWQYFGDPYVRARVMRPKIGRIWYDADACIAIVQACGRVVRSAEDYGVSYIIDGSWPRVAKYKPDWFEPEGI